METTWDSELARLMMDLSAVQEEMLAVLTKKRELLGAADTEGLAAIAGQEEKLIGKLQECLQRREQLLRQASEEGLPSANICSLAKALPKDKQGALPRQIREARGRARLLQHQSLTNWVLAQKSLIHLSQMLEIIATGGRLQPTYGKGETATAGGALVNQEA